MVKSLDGLISFLLDEIALCGEEGADPTEFVDDVNRYYNAASEEAENVTTNRPIDDSCSQPRGIDRQLHERAWRWFVNHPDVRVGQNGEGNKLSLSQVEAANKKRKSQTHFIESRSTGIPPLSDSLAQDGATVEQSPNPKVTSRPPKARNPKSSLSNPGKSSNVPPVYRVFVSEYRMWQAIAGHGPDIKRIPPMQFSCLSIITSRRTQGLLQSKLTEISGQDKRSVPHRTDLLAQNGYIEKRAVLHQSSKTSLLYAKRFAPKTESIPQASIEGQCDSHDDDKGGVGIIDYHPMFDIIVRLLQELGTITLVDLRKKMTASGLPIRKSVFGYSLKQFEYIGLAKEIKARVHHEDGLEGQCYRCLKLLREPKENDWALFVAGGARSDYRDKKEIEGPETDSDEDSDVAVNMPANPQAETASSGIREVVEKDRYISQWDPTRHLYNMIHDIVNVGGTEGVSTRELVYLTFGGGVTKPIERLLPRFVDSWQISQPLHLRHMALIRDTKIKMRNGYYVHYTYENFAKLVEREITAWDAVAATENNRKKAKTEIPPPGAQPDLDYYGFPRLHASSFYGSENDATLSECVLGTVTQSLPLKNIRTAVNRRGRPVNPNINHGQTEATADAQEPSIIGAEGTTGMNILIPWKRRTNTKLRGEFVSKKMIEKVALPSSLSHMNLQARNKLKGSQLAAIKYACGKAEKEILLRVESGESADAARTSVYAEVDAQHQEMGHLPPSEAMKAFLAGQYDDWRNQYEATARSQSRINKQAAKTFVSPTTYLPSVHAHTQRLLTSATVLLKQNQCGPTNKRAINAQVLHSVDVQTTPLVAAEPTTQPNSGTSRILVRQSRANTKSRRLIHYLPSVLAHTRPYLDPVSFKNRSQRKSQLPSHLADSIVLTQHGSDAPTATVATKRKRDPSDRLPPKKRKMVRDGVVSFHERLASSIHRSARPGVWVSEAERNTSRRGAPWGILAVFKSDHLKDRLQEWAASDPVAHVKGKAPASTPEQIKASVVSMYEKAQACNKPAKANTTGVDREGNLEPGLGDSSREDPNRTSTKTPAQPKANVFNALVFGSFASSNPRSVHTVNGSNSPLSVMDSHITEAGEAVPGHSSVPGSMPSDCQPDTGSTVYSNTAATAGRATTNPETPPSIAKPTETSKRLELNSAGETHIPEIQALPLANAQENVQQQNLELAHTNGCAMVDHSSAASARGATREPQSLVPFHDGTKLSQDSQESGDARPKLLPADTTAKRVVRISKLPQKLTPHGGSMAVLRRKIIMDLLGKCGGVMPGGKSLEIPFTASWQKHGHTGQPDSATIRAAINALEITGQVRPLTFSFKTSKGGMVTKLLVLDAKLSNDNPKVMEVQDQIIECEPYSYIPKEIRPDDTRQAFVNTVQLTKQTLIEADPTAKPRLQHKPLYQIRFEKRKQAAQERAQKKAEKTESERELAERRQKRRWKAEAQRTKKILAEIRSKYPKDKPLTAAQQQETLEEYRRAVEAWKALSGTEDLISLPVPPPVAEGRTFGEFVFLALPHVIKKPSFNTLTAPGPGSAEQIFKVARPRRVERLASLNNPLPRPRIGRFVHIGDLGVLDPSRASQDLRESPYYRIEQANNRVLHEDDRDAAYRDEESLGPVQPKDPPCQPSNPPWETLQLNTINPDRITSFHGLGRLLKSSEWDWSDEFTNDVDELLRWELHYTELNYSFEAKPFVNHTMLHKHKLAGNVKSNMNEAVKDSIGQTERSIKRPSRPPPQGFPYATGAVVGEIQAFSAFGRPSDQLRRVPNVVEDVEHESSSTDTPSSTRSVSPEPEVNDNVDDLQPFEQFGLFQNPVDAPTRIRFGQARALRGRKRKWQDDPPKTVADTARIHEDSLPNAGLSALQASPSQQEELREGQKPRKRIRLRGPRKLKGLSKVNEKRLLVTVIMVRTIAGGLDRHINWKLVAQVFEPELTEMFIHSIWNRVRDRNKLQYQRLLSEFQETFPKAYEEGTVPAMDFERLESYPWAWLVDWMLDVSDFPSEPTSTLELPSHRSGISDLFSLEVSSDLTFAPFFSPDTTNTVPRRHALLNKQAYACPLTTSPSLPRGQTDSKGLSIAKTWIRANITTPAATYNPDLARQHLSIFRPDVLERAVRELLSQKILSGQRENRVIPGRNYDLSDYCIYCLGKTPSVATLRATATFKTWLDEQFHTHGSVSMKTVAKDAQALVLTNLFAHHRIRLAPAEEWQPSKWGMLDGNYETRKLDKSRMKFAITIAPTAEYIYSNPLLPKLAANPPPSAHLEEPQPARIPLWYDINDEVVPVLWELALAAVLSTVSVRPGIQIGEIERAVKPAMAAWEILYVLEWGEKVGCLERVGEGWTLGEWWWGALDGDADVEGIGRETHPLGVGQEMEVVAHNLEEGNEREVDQPAAGDAGRGTLDRERDVDMTTEA